MDRLVSMTNRLRSLPRVEESDLLVYDELRAKSQFCYKVDS